MFNTERNFTYIGLNSYPAVNGAMLKDGTKYFGFVSANSALFNALDRNQFEIVLSRSTEHYDEKAIIEPLIDDDIDLYDQFIFMSNDIHKFEQSRLKFNQILNNKIKINVIKDVIEYQSSVNSLFNSDQISDNLGEIDFVDLNILSDSSLMIKLKNTKSHPAYIRSQYFKEAKTLDFLHLYNKEKPYQYTANKYSPRLLLDYKSDYLDTWMLDEEYHLPVHSYKGASFIIPEYKLIALELSIPPNVSD